MSKNLDWHEEDDEQYWESDKFTALDEIAYKSGIDTNIPDKGRNHDKEFMQSVDRAEFAKSREGKLQRAAILSTCMDNDEVQHGHFLTDLERSAYKTGNAPIITQGQYLEKTNRSNAATKGEFIGTVDDDFKDKIDKKYQNDAISDEDDDIFHDDENDEDFQRQLNQLRQERLKQLKEQNTVQDKGKVLSQLENMSNEVETQYPKQNLGVQNFVREIVPEQFQDLVMNQNGIVIMLVYKLHNSASEILLHCINVLSKRLPHIRFYVIPLSAGLSHVPENHCPLLMCYDKGKVVGSFPKLDQFRGSATSPLDVEWKLAQCGIIDTDLQEDPRDSDLFRQ